jgi:hypothetical protein
MTREEVMEMAYESGMIAGYEGEPDLLERFAALVAAQEREACKQWFIEDSERFAAQVALAEREACAKVCESLFDLDDDSCSEAEQCAAAIRARGNT